MPDPKEQEIGITNAGGKVSVGLPPQSGIATVFNAIRESRTIKACIAVAGGAAVDAFVNGMNWRQAVLAGVAALFAVLRTITTGPVVK